jgi:dGTP triphosphohydrolase
VVQAIFDLLVAEPERLPPGGGTVAERVTDYVAGMTDRFALAYAAGG